MSEQTVEPGKYVGLVYTILDDQGTIVDQRDAPLGFVFGSDTELIGGMDKAVRGSKVGDEVAVKLESNEAYGDRDPSLTFTDDVENVPAEVRQLGAEVEMQSEDGEVKTFYVTDISNGKLTLDGNHPLAGKSLTVIVRIVEVRDATPGEDKVSGIHASQMPAHPTIN